MDYAKPQAVAASMIASGRYKLTLEPRDLLMRGVLSGAIPGVAAPPRCGRTPRQNDHPPFIDSV